MTRADRRVGRFRSESARLRFFAAYDRALEAWPTRPSESDVATSYGTTHVLAIGAGSATPIVLLPGLAVSAPSWFADAAALSEGRRVYAVDTIGDVGRSVQTARVRDGSDMASWLDEVLIALDLERVHLVGLSYGGWLTVNQAVRAPERLASVTAVDPVGAIGRPQWTFLAGIVPDSILASVAKSDRALHRLMRRLNNGSTPRQPLLDISVAGLRTFVGKQPFPKRLTDDELRRVRTPALLLFCERSPVNRAPRAVQRSCDLIEGATAEVVPDAGHMLPVEKPALFTDRVLDFVHEVDGRSRAATAR